MKTVIYIDNNGNVTGLANDVLDKLSGLGKKHIERISNIEYDEDRGEWVARDNQGIYIASHPVRSKVIEAEQNYFNKLIEQNFVA